MARIYFETYGCQMNEADSRFLAEQAQVSGYRIVAALDEADVLVLNTCTVRDSAEKRAYGRLGHFKIMKAQNPTLKIVVCGCLAEQDRDRMLQRLPFVDALYGTHELPAMAERIASWAAEFGEEELVSTNELLAPLGAKIDGMNDAFTHLRAFVNVQYGCSYYCTYCIVPHVRGRFEHRSIEVILEETKGRVSAGAREIVLVGQTVNAYQDPTSELDFSDLLRRVAALPGLERLGFITSHPNNLSNELIAALAQVPQLSPRLHLALQSGSNAVLKRMNRKYTIETYLERIAAFRELCPTWALTSDLIVGFPGETEDDFQATLAIVESGIFAQVYSFAYSPRRGTPASRWDPVPAEISSDRLTRLLQAVNAGVQSYHCRKVGSTVRALVQGPSRKNPQRLAAKTADNVTIIVPIEGDAERFSATPWLEVAIERAHVWGCAAVLLGVSATYDGPYGAPSAPALNALPPLIDLISR